MSTGSLRRLAWQVLVYGSGRLGLQLFSLITLPVLTRVFTPAEYGIVETVTTLAALVAIIATLALNSAVQRSYFDYTGGRERRTVVSTGLWASLAWSSLLCLSLATAAKPPSCRVRRITAAEFGAKAARPAYSVLRSEKGAPVLPHWREGLRACLSRLDLSNPGA